jgi:hypothetical protein
MVVCLTAAKFKPHCSNYPTYNILAQTVQKESFLCCVHICWEAHVIVTQPLLATAIVYRAIT